MSETENIFSTTHQICNGKCSLLNYAFQDFPVLTGLPLICATGSKIKCAYVCINTFGCSTFEYHGQQYVVNHPAACYNDDTSDILNIYFDKR